MLTAHQSIRVSNPFDDLIDYFEQIATPEEILAFKVSEKGQERAEDLLDKNREGMLMIDEFIELQHMLHFNRRMTALRASAHEHLSKK